MTNPVALQALVEFKPFPPDPPLEVIYIGGLWCAVPQEHKGRPEPDATELARKHPERKLRTSRDW